MAFRLFDATYMCVSCEWLSRSLWTSGSKFSGVDQKPTVAKIWMLQKKKCLD